MGRLDRVLWLVLAGSVALGASGCFRRTFVVVPQRDGGYGPRDTLYGRRDGRNVRVVFQHDTTWRVDTVVRTDTLWRGGTRIIRDTVLRVVRDTLYLPVTAPGTVPRVPATGGGPAPTGGVPRANPAPRRDTVYLPDPRRARDTVYLPRPGSGRTDTVRVTIRDTVFLPRAAGARTDTVRVTVRDTIRLTVRDTIRLTVRDTIRDTVRVVVRDTVVVPGGRRLISVPPGQFPRDGQCRIWIHDRPPGQQARALPCAEIGPVPPGGFVLFDDIAWDMDHDWVAESRRTPVPAEILAIARRARP